MRRAFAVAVACALTAGAVASTPAVARQHPGPVQRTEVRATPVRLPAVDHVPTHAAAAHLAAQSHAWGVAARDFTISRTTSVGTGATVRFDQRVNGVRALGGYAALTVDQDGALVSDVVRTIASPASVAPVWDAATARQRVAAAVPGASRRDAVRSLENVVVDGATVDSLGDSSQFAWLSRVAVAGGEVSALLADGTAQVLWLSPTVRDAVDDPLLCDYRDSMASAASFRPLAADYPLCTSAITPGLKPGRDQVAIDDFTRLQSGLSATVSYYRDVLGATQLARDDSGAAVTADVAGWEFLGNIAPALNFGVNYSTDPTLRSADDCGASLTDSCAPRIHALISACAPGVSSCTTYENAYWNAWASSRCNDPTDGVASGVCGAANFGRGWAVDDIVAHEVTHGVTGYMFPDMASDETNALAEAYSDFIAEAVDQTTVTLGEAPDAAWKFGEDVGTSLAGTPVAGLSRTGPFRTVASAWSWERKSISSSWNRFDEAHYNLGPADRFAWLVANGGTQSGYTIDPLGTTPWPIDGTKTGLCTDAADCTGITRMSQLVMSALPLMPAPHARYLDFGRAVVVACANLAALSVEGFTTSSCGEVRQALVATKILRIRFTSYLTRLGRVRVGSTRTVAATLKTSTGARAAGVPVKFQMRRSKRAAWTTLAESTTTATGAARFTVTLSRSGYYRIVSARSASVPYVTSRTRWVSVR